MFLNFSFFFTGTVLLLLTINAFKTRILFVFTLDFAFSKVLKQKVTIFLLCTGTYSTKYLCIRAQTVHWQLMYINHEVKKVTVAGINRHSRYGGRINKNVIYITLSHILGKFERRSYNKNVYILLVFLRSVNIWDVFTAQEIPLNLYLPFSFKYTHWMIGSDLIIVDPQNNLSETI